MTRQDFIRYLSRPDELNGESVQVLEKIVKQYPYFQTARMLYLKNLHNERSIEYEKNLNITSAYAPAGKVLYNLLKSKPDVRRLEHSANLQTIVQPDVTTSSLTEVFLKEEAIVVLQEMSMREVHDTEQKPMAAQEIEKDEYDELQLLEKEMLKEAYKTSLTVDLHKELMPQLQDKSVERQPADERNGFYSFNHWLKLVSGKNPSPAVEDNTISKKQQGELIDRFILEETSRAIAKPKVDFYSAEAMAKKSITDDETFVTETLASIYLRQGNLPKALRAYEILVVKYPEKIHIFAPLLEKIKNLLKEQKHK